MTFSPEDAAKHTVAADTTKLREVWAREANTRISQGFNEQVAINFANMTVKKRIRKRKRNGRRS